MSGTEKQSQTAFTHRLTTLVCESEIQITRQCKALGDTYIAYNTR